MTSLSTESFRQEEYLLLRKFTSFYSIVESEVQNWYFAKLRFLRREKLWFHFAEENMELFNQSSTSPSDLIQSFKRSLNQLSSLSFNNTLTFESDIFETLIEFDQPLAKRNRIDSDHIHAQVLCEEVDQHQQQSQDSSSRCKIRYILPYSGTIDLNVCQALIRESGLYTQCRDDTKKQIKVTDKLRAINRLDLDDKLCSTCVNTFVGESPNPFIGFIEDRELIINKKIAEKKIKDKKFEIKSYQAYCEKKGYQISEVLAFAKKRNFYFDEKLHFDDSLISSLSVEEDYNSEKEMDLFPLSDFEDIYTV